ncbi:MAG: ATP-dependent DNA helicase RecG, partial [Clostridia bacterium]|nr:ATP-dependent DNA helicase RecG [Clostridia bacterium]
VFSDLPGELSDPLPEYIRKQYDLTDIYDAYKQIHFPESATALEQARRRFVFEEFFFLQTALFRLKGRREKLNGEPIEIHPELKNFVGSLPFALTNAQKRVLTEILTDMKKDTPMNRLVQGDVGSGKTAVAACAMFSCAKSGMQAAFMVPTEILAAQHFESIAPLFSAFGIKTELITGSMSAGARRKAQERIASGESSVCIGTHALFSEQMEFQHLNLVITDEQHRFGVNQRKQLGDKGTNPHTLVMTATPIPRTLALAVYGDLDVSAIDELPPGRQIIDTYPVGEDMRKRIYAFIRKEVNAGHQAYIVCPLVEDSEVLDLKSVTNYAEELKNDVFPDLSVAFLHGKMKAAEKDEIMRQFAEKGIDILVATSVIEVGVNVPNATVMVVENAERFGLSQLHQLRGRVGRGKDKSYCILFNQSQQDYAKERMEVMRRTNDGFIIAEKDLELRGPGEFFGTRQHGLPPLKIANLYSDTDVLAQTTAAARALLVDDPLLKKPENSKILEKIQQIFQKNITFS